MKVDGQMNGTKDLSSRAGSSAQVETHKLDLMAENSTMKLRMAALERDKQEAEKKAILAQRQIDELQDRLNERTIEAAELRSKLVVRLAPPTSSPSSPDRSDSFRDKTLDKEKTLDRLKRKHTEVEKLKKAVDCLMVCNEEKDRHIEELGRLLGQYKHMDNMMTIGSQGSATTRSSHRDEDHSDSSSNKSSSLLDKDTAQVDASNGLLLPPDATSTPVSHKQASPIRLANGHHTSPRLSPPSTIMEPSTPNNHIGRSNSFEGINPLASKTPPSAHRLHNQSYGTLPREARQPSHSSTIPRERGPSVMVNAVSQRPPLPTGHSTAPRKSRPFMSFGKGFLKAKSRWSTSAPNLAQTEAEEEALKDEMAQQYKQMQRTGGGNELQRKKSKGFKKFFGKLRRSSSQDFDKDNLEEFKRNGLRSTAGARLGWSKDLTLSDQPFAQWDAERLSMWMHAIGLSMYVGQCKRWLKNGDQLLKASNHELEKELGIRNHFHRKKLQLALQRYSNNDSTRPSGMDLCDHNFVTRWLDDIGLPQYKDAFSEALIDGRMLHFLSVEDLLHLRVTNSLHHLCIKTGIQVLRENDFNQNCLKRRPAPDDGQLQNCPEEVSLWTNHRVMEWLRSIDLSEYSPNLRGSGVHGGLMVLEPHFSADLFAAILSIPSSKTLLRRHLNTHFVALIGNHMQQRKRNLEAKPGYIPLTPNQKVKLRKFGIFSHRRTRSVADEDLVCPLTNEDVNQNGDDVTIPYENSTRDSREIRRRGVDSFSQEISSLADLLAKDGSILDDVPTSDV
ncbi:hypothetical protein CAPTEDRAFT_227812 [Capitella teleta]|uniref:SAM domain-containing protein n=1 Tax=Capitella teleta TaxID=283909 RepID=R7VCR0_CAPTE|nr:hypothetical protein CAPTEDRAFT_227812 [Capitella teleta]|eukprot:ELU16424.1 hypothetical protein CAPTEDRAFT_227812 [Capitella teleta]